jgi:hypothetical protein
MDKSKLPVVLQEADMALEEYVKFMRNERELVTDLELAAKDLFHEVRKQCHHDKQEFNKQKLDSKTVQADLQDVMKNQEARWNILNAKTQKLTTQAEAQWAKVEAAKKKVEEARTTHRDNKFSAAWGDFPTEEQAAIRNYYSKKLQPNFLEAQERHKGLVSYPEGKLQMVRLYQKQANEEIKRTIDMMESRETQTQLLGALHAS